MIYISEEAKVKIALLDKLISTTSVEDLTALVSEQLVANELKGTKHSECVFQTVLTEMYIQQSELELLKQDMRQVVSILNRPVSDSSKANMMSSLISKYGVY